MIVTLKVDRGNRFTLVRRDEGSHWRDVREPPGLWAQQDKDEFAKNLAKYVAGLRRNCDTVVFSGPYIQELGHFNKAELTAMRKRLLENVRSMIRELLEEGGFGTPDEQSRAAAERLRKFRREIKRAPDILIGRLLAGSRSGKFWKKWDMHRSLVAEGGQNDGMDALDAVASACEPEL